MHIYYTFHRSNTSYSNHPKWGKELYTLKTLFQNHYL